MRTRLSWCSIGCEFDGDWAGGQTQTAVGAVVRAGSTHAPSGLPHATHAHAAVCGAHHAAVAGAGLRAHSPPRSASRCAS
jgi:poly-gamma-glutamate capsule biosynthesis protein CapA/YwtB (metallophosphatase superfamily)